MIFSKIDSYDTLVGITKKEIQILLQDFCRHLKECVHPNTVSGCMASVFKFLDCNEVEYNQRHIKSMYPSRKRPTNELGYTLEQIQKLVKFQKNHRNKTLTIFLASTGCRQGAIMDLKRKHLVPIENCYMVKVYAGDKEEYVTFTTPEATSMLNEYFEGRERRGETLTPESYVFTYLQKNQGKRWSPMSFKSMMMYDIINSNLGRIKNDETGRYDVAAVHGFRKFADTMLEEAGISYNNVQKIIGHKNGLAGLYYTPKSSKLFEEYKKAIPNLTIQKEFRQENLINNFESKREENTGHTGHMKELEEKIEMQEKMIDKLRNQDDDYQEHFANTQEDIEKMVADAVYRALKKKDSFSGILPPVLNFSKIYA